MNDLQKVIVDWHVKRFPEAQIEHIALKLCEEAGEVARAVNGVAGKNSATGRGNVVEEIADVLIVANVLMGRWYEDDDMVAAVEAKMKTLLDPHSGHRAAALVD